MSNTQAISSALAMLHAYEDRLTHESRLAGRADRVWLCADSNWLYIHAYKQYYLQVSEAFRISLCGEQTGQVQYCSATLRNWFNVRVPDSAMADRMRGIASDQHYFQLCVDLLSLFRTSFNLQAILQKRPGGSASQYQRIGSGPFAEKSIADKLPEWLRPVAVVGLKSGEPIALERFPLQVGEFMRMHIYSASVLPTQLRSHIGRSRESNARLGFGFPVLSADGTPIGELVTGTPVLYLLLFAEVESLGYWAGSRLANQLAKGLGQIFEATHGGSSKNGQSSNRAAETLAHQAHQSLIDLLSSAPREVENLSRQYAVAQELGLW